MQSYKNLSLTEYIQCVQNLSSFYEQLKIVGIVGAIQKYVTHEGEGGGQMGCDKVRQGREREFCNMWCHACEIFL